jgi:hypothetical protein
MADQTYFPVASVELVYRFDPAYIAPDPVLANQTPTDPAPTQSPSPLFLSTGGQDAYSFRKTVIPITCDVDIPTIRSAGKFRVRFNYRDVPMDPRMFSAIGVTIRFGTVDSSIASRPSRTPRVPDPTTFAGVMVGVADTAFVEHTESGSYVELEGRDLRGLLADSKAPAAMFSKLDLRKDIGDVVNQILGLHPFGPYFQAILRRSGQFENGKLPSPYASGDATRVQLGADGKGSTASTAASDEVSFWDLIVNYCYVCGVVPYFKTTLDPNAEARLVLAPLRTYYQQEEGDTPFSGRTARTTPDGRTIRVRELAYGRDVSQLSFERKFQGAKGRGIRVVCLNTSSKQRGTQKLLEVTRPEGLVILKNKKAKDKLIGATKDQIPGIQAGNIGPIGNIGYTDIQTIVVNGVTSKRQLELVADAIYEEIGRGELSGSCETRNLASFGGSSADPDLIFLRPGDAIRIGVNPAVALGITGTYSDTTANEATLTKYYTDQGFPSPVASALAQSAVRGTPAAQPYFRVNNVKMTWSNQNGLKIAFDFQNYVESGRQLPNRRPTIRATMEGATIAGGG